MDKARSILIGLNSLVNAPNWGKQSRERLNTICTEHALFEVQSEAFQSLEVQISRYEGMNPNVLGMMRALQSRNAVGIHSVILQGSLATDEEIAYSDFDALVVLRDSVFADARSLLSVIDELQLLSRYLTLQDPLQHHGWFVTTEKLLQNHFDDFFPVEIFKHSRLLYPDNPTLGLKLKVTREPNAYSHQLASTIRAIEKELDSGQYVKNLYELKSTLSKFMLLPALYVQLRDGKGVYKKDSFEAARRDFSASEWKIMGEISDIRSAWKQDLSAPRRWLISFHPSWTRKVAKHLAPAVPPRLKEEVLTNSGKMQTFARLISERARIIHAER
jgi:hypothetical protein